MFLIVPGQKSKLIFQQKSETIFWEVWLFSWSYVLYRNFFSSGKKQKQNKALLTYYDPLFMKLIFKPIL